MDDNESPLLATTGSVQGAFSRVARACSAAALAVLCVASLAAITVACGTAGRDVVGQLAYSGAFLVWVVLPWVGILLAVPGLRPPRGRAAVVALIGNAVVLLALPAMWLIVTLVAGP
ncbi:MAG: hypothetical protein JOZ47_15785 [Kutzneria sp.]|nr:hypothetical protein [Kutzneria sp.]